MKSAFLCIVSICSWYGWSLLIVVERMIFIWIVLLEIVYGLFIVVVKQKRERGSPDHSSKVQRAFLTKASREFSLNYWPFQRWRWCRLFFQRRKPPRQWSNRSSEAHWHRKIGKLNKWTRPSRSVYPMRILDDQLPSVRNTTMINSMIFTHWSIVVQRIILWQVDIFYMMISTFNDLICPSHRHQHS